MIHHYAFNGASIFLWKDLFCFRDKEVCWKPIGSGWFAIHTPNIQIKKTVILETGAEGKIKIYTNYGM